MQLTPKDLNKLKQCHPVFQAFVKKLAEITTIPFTVGETGRSEAQQKKNIANHVSWTMHSRHIKAPDGLVYAGDLLPLVAGKVTWAWPVYYKFAAEAKRAIALLGLEGHIEWGGDWKTNKDGPHWQLNWKLYPGAKK